MLKFGSKLAPLFGCVIRPSVEPGRELREIAIRYETSVKREFGALASSNLLECCACGGSFPDSNLINLHASVADFFRDLVEDETG